MDASSDYRHHRTTSINSSSASSTATATSELFICFTSRLSSSSSMKISSKSILSPARSRDASQAPQISLSSSLSRRLRTNGSLKGGGQASPMFPSGGKKRGGSGYDNPEPSSPKVTCIGQVRVKTKKQGKKLRTNGSQQRKGGEVSFRKLELSRSGHHSFQQPHLGTTPEGLPHRNQRWVHFPVTVCEALRTLGADWNCFLPCRSYCMSSKEDKAVAAAAAGGGGGSGDGGSSCGAVNARWLVAVQDREGKERKEIELVVGGEEIDDRSYRSQRRHIFEGIDFSEEKKEAAKEDEEEEGKVSINIPPKNALLLMRCRSDPVKMAALANRFCGSLVPRSDEDDDNKDKEFVDCVEKIGEIEVEEVGIGEEQSKFEEEMDELEVIEECGVRAEAIEEQSVLEEEADSISMVEEEEDVYQEVKVNDKDLEEESEEKPKEGGEEDDEELETELLCGFLFRDDPVSDQEDDELVEASSENQDSEDDDGSEFAELGETVKWEAAEDAEEPLEADARFEPENQEPDDGDPNRRSKVREREDKRLPDCLLLMMCEPKLSMEVSKETWVCSTDFIRWLPERHPSKAVPAGEEPEKKRKSTDRRPGGGLTAHQTRILQQPPRNSVSFPTQGVVDARRSFVGSGDGGESMAAVIEKKLRSAKPGEPLVLTRCKSEPMRSTMKVAAPDACFWKNRKREPHRPPNNFRVKAAGIGC